MFGSLGSRALAMEGRLAMNVAGRGARGETFARSLLNRGMATAGRRGTAMAMAGSAVGKASRIVAKNPRRVMYGGAAGAAGLASLGDGRRRGSQNYPMY